MALSANRRRVLLGVPVVCLAALPALLLVSCGDAPSPDPAPTIRFDGIYRTPATADESEDGWSYLRFYADGLVVAGAALAEAPWQLEHWLNRRGETRGQYVITNGRVEISCTGPFGALEYEGLVTRDGLSLNWVSHITDEKGKAEYTFLPSSAGMEAPWGGVPSLTQIHELEVLGVPIKSGGLIYRFETRRHRDLFSHVTIGLTPQGRATVDWLTGGTWGVMDGRFTGRWRVSGDLVLLEVKPLGGGEPFTYVAAVRDRSLLTTCEQVPGHGHEAGDPMLRPVLPTEDDSDSMVLQLMTAPSEPSEESR